MIAAYQRDIGGVSHLERQKEKKGLDTIEAPIDKIPHEQVIGARAVVSHPEKLHQVVELAMDIATDGDRGVDLLNVRLLDQDLLGEVAKVAHLGFLDVLATPQLLNLSVQVVHYNNF